MNFISTFDELNKLYESVEPGAEEVTEPCAESVDAGANETEATTDGELEEGIFGPKKGSAEWTNAQRAFERKVKDIASSLGCDATNLQAIGRNAAHKLKDCVSVYGSTYRDNAQRQGTVRSDSASVDKFLSARAEVIIGVYEELLKTFKSKPDTYEQAAGAIENAARRILDKYMRENSNLFDEIKGYCTALRKVSAIDAESKLDKKIQHELLVDLFKAIHSTLTFDLQQLKKKQGYKLFEAVDDAEEIDIELEAEAKPVDDESSEIEVIDDEQEEAASEEIPTQLVLECTNCGALVIKAEAEVEIDEKTDLANVEEECKFCNETAGYEVLGTFTPASGSDDSADTADTDVAEDE